MGRKYMNMEQIIIIIPAYEPDIRLLMLLEDLHKNKIAPVLLINDGSGDKYVEIFNRATDILKDQGILLVHEVNRGKGRALKTAFQYVLDNFPNAVGVITADSDGQHTVEDIGKIRETLLRMPGHLVLGVRDFSMERIPWRSRFGNNLTQKVHTYLTGIHISDTQTGLRGIPKSFMEELLNVKGERFEFEMRMLLVCAGRYTVTEVPIDTIYDSEKNHKTHFDPIMDSIRIYRILGEKFFKYIFTSFSASCVDLLLFYVACILWKRIYPDAYIAMATIAARIVSAIYNYAMNYNIVFKSNESVQKAGVKYAILAAIQMGLSAIYVTLFLKLMPIVPEIVIKMIIDVSIFFISYHIQQKYVFKKG